MKYTIPGNSAWIAVLALSLVSVSTAAQTPPPPDSTVSEGSYTNPVHRWSVAYPPGWSVDSTNPGGVRIHSPAKDGLCGINSGVVRFKTVDEFTDFMQAQTERYFRDRGVTVRSAPKQRISLPNDVIGNDVLTEILSGGRSRRIYVLADTGGYVIDCETYAKNWGKLEPSFDRIINSFTLANRNENRNEMMRLLAQGRFAEAREAAEKALRNSEETLGPDHPDVANDLHNLAEFYNNDARSSNDETTRQRAATMAESMLVRALAIREKTIGLRNSFAIDTMISLADDYSLLRRDDEAVTLYKRAIEILNGLGSSAPILLSLRQRATNGLNQLDKERRK